MMQALLGGQCTDSGRQKSQRWAGGLATPQVDATDEECGYGPTPAIVSQLVRGGHCVEIPAPDCAAHGVAVALHAFT
jgi:hypothetical protein